MEEIKPSTKLFGDHSSKHLKEMSEVKRAGQQMQKVANGSAHINKANGLNLTNDHKTIVLMLSSAVLF